VLILDGASWSVVAPLSGARRGAEDGWQDAGGLIARCRAARGSISAELVDAYLAFHGGLGVEDRSHHGQQCARLPGRSHSLWYCDPFVEGEFSWYELAFMNHAFGGQPDIVPFALPAREARIACEPVVGTMQIPWPFQEIDRSDPTEFLGRWLGWFAQTAAGTLQQPSMLPERQTDRTWRR
jgi:hypothetical protein